MRIFPAQLREINPFLLVLFLLVCFVPVSLYLAREEKIQELVKDLRGNIIRADLTIHQFHYTEREKGERKWEIWAERAERFKDPPKVHLDQVKMRYFLKEDGWVDLSGDFGDYFEKEERVELSQEVQVHTDSGYSLYTDQLIWEQEKNLIRSEKPVRFVAELYTTKGERMSFNTETRQLEMTGEIRTVVTPARQEQGVMP
jgi:LPS export ABC transporter protein LptC